MGKGPVHFCAARRRKWFGRNRSRTSGADRARSKSPGREYSSGVAQGDHSAAIELDPRRYRDNLDQKPAALNIVDFRDATRARLTLFNDTSHYDKAGSAIPEIPQSRLSKWWNARGA